MTEQQGRQSRKARGLYTKDSSYSSNPLPADPLSSLKISAHLVIAFFWGLCWRWCHPLGVVLGIHGTLHQGWLLTAPCCVIWSISLYLSVPPYFHLSNASCCCSAAKLSLTLCDPTDCSTPGSSVLHRLQQFAQIHVRFFCNAI